MHGAAPGEIHTLKASNETRTDSMAFRAQRLAACSVKERVHSGPAHPPAGSISPSARPGLSDLFRIFGRSRMWVTHKLSLVFSPVRSIAKPRAVIETDQHNLWRYALDCRDWWLACDQTRSQAQRQKHFNRSRCGSVNNQRLHILSYLHSRSHMTHLSRRDKLVPLKSL